VCNGLARPARSADESMLAWNTVTNNGTATETTGHGEDIMPPLQVRPMSCTVCGRIKSNEAD